MLKIVGRKGSAKEYEKILKDFNFILPKKDAPYTFNYNKKDKSIIINDNFSFNNLPMQLFTIFELTNFS